MRGRAAAALGERCAGLGSIVQKVCDDVSLLFPLREGDVIGVLQQQRRGDGEAQHLRFLMTRSSSRETQQAAGAGVCRARTGVLDTEPLAPAADEVLASFVEGEGGVASDLSALRWCFIPHETVE